MYKIPVSRPSITALERKYVADAMKSGWVSSKGPYIEKFEQAWAKANDMGFGSACSSGTTALLLALRALNIKEGDEVIVPNFTMIATAWAVTYCGAKPVFVDCKNDLTIDPELIEEKITPKTRAIMPVHIYGRQCDMEAIMRIAHDYNLFVVEDLAEAHGVKPVGDIGCYSFFGNKIITTGEGGMCLTNDKKLKEQIDHLRSMAFDHDHTFVHKKLGYNFRMTNLQAAMGLAQVERFPQILKKRKQIEKWYRKYLTPVIPNGKPLARNVLWMLDVRIGDNSMARAIREELSKQGIETRPFFRPMTEQPMYRENGYEYTKAYEEGCRGFYLPTFTDMTEKDIQVVCEAVREAISTVDGVPQ